MIRAVVWKEWREQGLIGLALVVLGSGILVAVAMLADPPSPSAAPTDVIRSLGLGRLATLMLVVTAGMVCGGALFAAEREAGTMPFLETLPAPRWRLWYSKMVAGFGLAVVQIVLLLATAFALELADVPFARRVVIYSLMAFAWGALGSTLARTTLGSVGVAIPSATLATFIFLVPIYIFFTRPGTSFPRPSGWVLFEVLMLGTPLLVSAWRFTALDRDRAANDTTGSAVPGVALQVEHPPSPPTHTRAGMGFRALAWLALRQMVVPGSVLSVFALVCGLSLLAPGTQAVFVWPGLALAAGVLAGVLAFGDEQTHDTARFWGERRLPIGRAWMVKIGLHLALTAWLLVLLALPSIIRSQFEQNSRFAHGPSIFSSVFRSRLFDEIGSHGWKYLLLPAAYGFAVGHLCGLLFRKLVVASGVAVMVAGSLAALWMPSLLAGGVKHWQVWLPAALILFTGRLLIRPWATDRALNVGPLLRLTGGSTAALLALAAGIAYRVVEVPDDPSGSDDITYVNSLPAYDVNYTGREFRAAAERYSRVATASAAMNPDLNRPIDGRRRPRIDERLDMVLRAGWSPADAELGAWLNRVFADRPTNPDEKAWFVQATEAAAKPVGFYEPPQLTSTATATAVAMDNARKMAITLLARGLQQQAAGDPVSFVQAFRTTIALARNVRSGSGIAGLSAALDIERIAFLAADRWLERLAGDGAGDVARTLTFAMASADELPEFDPRPHILADRYTMRELMKAPSHWLTAILAPHGTAPEQATPEADLIAFAWNVPWERERTRRLVGLTIDGTPLITQFRLVTGRPGSGLLLARHRSLPELIEADRQIRVVRRVSVLKTAVRAFQTNHGNPPATLTALIEKRYLDRLPDDPYAERGTFGYRVSEGEMLRNPPRAGPHLPGRGIEESPTIPVQRGQMILWSVGADRIDQGGRVPPGGARAEDLVFLVPLPLPKP